MAAIRCPYCGDTSWTDALGSGPLKVAGVILGEYDEQGDVSIDPGIEVAAYACTGCGYIRLYDPRFVPPAL